VNRSRGSRARSHSGLIAVALFVAACETTGPTGTPTTNPAASPTPSSTPTPSAPATPTPSSTSAPVAAVQAGAWHVASVPIQLQGMAWSSSGVLAIGNGKGRAILWTSTNGEDWEVADDSVTFDRVLVNGVASNSHGTVIIGCAAQDGICTAPAVWLGPDGWQRVGGAAFSTVTSLDRILASGSTFYVTGTDKDYHQKVWFSTDGRTWKSAPPLSVDGEGILGMAGDADGFMAVGTDLQAENAPALIWTSKDGIAWDSREVPADATVVTSVAGYRTTFVVGGSTADGAGAVWTSSDGATFQPLKTPADDICGQEPVGLIAAGRHGTLASEGVGCRTFLLGSDGSTGVSDPSQALGFVDGPGGFLGYDDTDLLGLAAAQHPPLDLAIGSDSGNGWTEAQLPAGAPETGIGDSKGRLLVFSAADSSGTIRVDRWDGGKHTWTRRPDVAAGITHAKAVAGHGGLVYLVGLSVDGRHGRTVEYDPIAATWRLRASMPTARTGFGIAERSGKVYVFGGRVSPCCDGVKGSGALSTVEQFDERANAWKRLADMPIADASPGAIAAASPTDEQNPLGGPSGPPTTLYVFLPTRVWTFDPVKGSWTPGPTNLAYGETGSPVLGIDGLVRVSNCDRYDVFDPTSGHWQGGQPIAAGCDAIAVASSIGNVFVFGGSYLPSPGRRVLAYWAGGG
jgi:Kelch motif